MGDLVEERIDEALDLMEPQIIELAGGRNNARTAMVHLFDYCGRPLDSQFQHEERGFKLYLTGRHKEMRKFFYDTRTDQFPKGVCSYGIEVVPGDTAGYTVTSFGPLKPVGR
jgi:hypothetical protein